MNKRDKKSVTISLKLSEIEAAYIKFISDKKKKSMSNLVREAVFQNADFEKFKREKGKSTAENTGGIKQNNTSDSLKINENYSEFDGESALYFDGLQEKNNAVSDETDIKNKSVSYRKNLYFTPEEYEIISTNAAANGRTFNAFIKECASKGGSYQFNFSEIRAHTAELSRLSETINLLTESIVSANKIYDYQLETIVFRMDDILESERIFLSDMRKLYKRLDKKIQQSFSLRLKNGKDAV